ncbi:thioredoxin peroxidase Tpx1 [Kappamyces sp. JEL0829]|nr:thioredoxin peroxidase Tpx1 [Kappamyces sp. JEL0829]
MFAFKRVASSPWLKPSAFIASRWHHVARVQKPAPFFAAPAVVNKEFKQVSLDDYKDKWLGEQDGGSDWHRQLMAVLFFYPLDFTFVCPTEIIAYSERIDEFKALGAEVVGCSVDSKFSHLAWINMPRKEGGLGKMNIPLLADVTKKISRDYGVLLDEGDDAGIVRQITINDLSVGRSVDETLRLLEGYQFAAEHGEVCPANWKKGAKTMKPNPTESKSYFQSQH